MTQVFTFDMTWKRWNLIEVISLMEERWCYYKMWQLTISLGGSERKSLQQNYLTLHKKLLAHIMNS